jgi:hypothetical protein
MLHSLAEENAPTSPVTSDVPAPQVGEWNGWHAIFRPLTKSRERSVECGYPWPP